MSRYTEMYKKYNYINIVQSNIVWFSFWQLMNEKLSIDGNPVNCQLSHWLCSKPSSWSSNGQQWTVTHYKCKTLLSENCNIHGVQRDICQQIIKFVTVFFFIQMTMWAYEITYAGSDGSIDPPVILHLKI